MSSFERTAKRAKKKRSTQLTRKQAKLLGKGLNNLRLKKGELADSTQTLFDLIALFENTMTADQVAHYTDNEKFVVVSLDDPSPDPLVKIREGIIHFPIFGLQVVCMVNTQGARTTVYLMGNDNKKYLAVNSFLNFFDAEEQVKITGYYVARELAAYFNSLTEHQTNVPTVALSDAIGDIDDTETIESIQE